MFERIAEEELSDASKKIKDSTTSMSDVSIISEAPGPISFTAQSSSQFHQVARADHHVFRRGLHRALKMGRFFARRASRVEGKKWRIQEIEPEFEIAVHGNLGLVNVEGNAALSLEFERKESK